MSFKSLFFLAILLIVFSSANAKNPMAIYELHNYPLFDNEYKLAANYLPILALRGLAHADIYKNKKSAHLERYYYVKDLQGKFSKPYQTLILDIDVKGHGFIGREVNAKGKLNEYDLEYNNQLSFSLPRKANMKVIARLDDIKILDLDIKSDGTTMTNNVVGLFLGEKVNYQTTLRDTEGVLGGHKYTIHTEGSHPDVCSFEATTKGIIGSTEIYGKGRMIKANYYEFEENYGPILVKTKLTIKNPISEGNPIL